MFNFRLENENGKIVDINDGVNYLVIAASGLNPPSAQIYTSPNAGGNGKRKSGSSLDERNLLITVKFYGDIEKSRNALYEWIDSEQYVKVHYQNGVKSVYCEGYVQDCPIDFFSDNEVVDIAIVCPKPHWKELQEISTDISALLKLFTFPFAIDSAGIPFSTIRTDNETNIYNAGAETGVQITVKCNAAISGLLIYDANDTTKRFYLNYELPESCVLKIDTESNPKTCKAYLSDGSEVSLIRYVGNNPTWFTLKKGNNRFGHSYNGTATDAEISIGFVNKYLGV